MNNMKDYREKELPLYIISNILIFLIVHQFIVINVNDFSKTEEVISQVFKSTVLLIIAYSFILVVECLFTSRMKSQLLYLFGFFGLLNMPGCTIFTKIRIKNKDNRFSYKSLVNKYPELYDNLPLDNKERLRYENEKWNAIYNQHRDIAMVHYSNRDWLLCRDIYISTLSIIGLYSIIAILRLVEFNCHYLLFTVILAAISNIGANRKAVRFAYNVISYDVNIPSS